MTVQQLIQELNKFNPETIVLGEFDSDGDDFMVKVPVINVYKDNGVDDSGFGDNEENYCIIGLDY